MRVDRPELRAVDRHHAAGNQLELAADGDELLAGELDRVGIVPPEISDRLEVGAELAGEPHQLGVAARLALEAPARAQLVEVAVDIELEHHRWVVAGPPGGGGLHALEAKRAQIELVDKGIDHAGRVVGVHILIEAIREKSCLASVLTLDETRHQNASREQVKRIS